MNGSQSYGMVANTMPKPLERWEILAANLEQLMKEQGWNALQLSRALVPRQADTAVRDLLQGRSKNPGHDRLSAIAAKLGVTVERLYQLPGQSEDGRPAAVTVQSEIQRGTLVLRIPANTPLAEQAQQLLQFYNEASEETRRHVMFKLQHPDLVEGGTILSGREAEARLERAITQRVDAAIADGSLKVDGPGRLRLIANLTEEGLTVMRGSTAQSGSAKPAGPTARRAGGRHKS